MRTPEFSWRSSTLTRRNTRATLIKSLLRNGLKNLRRERAVEAFRRDEVTLSRAAELAGLTPWDFLALMDSEKLELHYDVAEFEEDLRALS